MFITVTIKMCNTGFNIKIDNNQPIINGIIVLKQAHKYNGEIADFYRSKISDKVVSGYLTFGNAGIHSGDVLEAIIN